MERDEYDHKLSSLTEKVREASEAYIKQSRISVALEEAYELAKVNQAEAYDESGRLGKALNSARSELMAFIYAHATGEALATRDLY